MALRRAPASILSDAMDAIAMATRFVDCMDALLSA